MQLPNGYQLALEVSQLGRLVLGELFDRDFNSLAFFKEQEIIVQFCDNQFLIVKAMFFYFGGMRLFYDRQMVGQDDANFGLRQSFSGLQIEVTPNYSLVKANRIPFDSF